MAAENALRATSPAVRQSLSVYFGGQAQPHGIKPLQKADDSFVPKRDLLQAMMKSG